MKRLILCVFSIVLMFSSLTAVAAQNGNSALSLEEQQKLDQRTKELEDLFLDVAVAAGKIQQLKEKLAESKELNDTDVAKSYTDQVIKAEEEYYNLKATFSERGLKKISKENKNEVSVLATTNADFDDNGEFAIYYDSNAGKYLAHYGGIWQNNNYINDTGCDNIQGCSGTISIGGSDGVGIFSLHEDLNIYNRKFFLMNENLNATERTNNNLGNPVDVRGAGYEWQDTIEATRWPGFTSFENFNSYRILMWYHFDFQDGVPYGKTVSFKAEVGHTWNTTSVSSISVGPWAIGIGFNTSSNRWIENDLVHVSF